MTTTVIRQLAQDYLRLEALFARVIRATNVEDESTLRQDYTWERAQFILKLADLCGEDASGIDLNPHETTMEFSLEVG